MNENHLRHVVTTFHYIDRLLSEAERVMREAPVPSPFQEYADDTTAAQRNAAHDYIARIRDIMTRRLKELRVTRSEPGRGALWAARNNVLFSTIALADMEPSRMEGFGTLSAEDARKLDGVIDELRGQLKSLGDYLAQDASQGQDDSIGD